MNEPRMVRKPLPKKARSLYWIEVPAAGEAQEFIVASPDVWGFDTHYDGVKKTTRPCYEDHAFCEGGHKPDNIRWRGYLFGWSHKRKKMCFVQLTEAACREFLKSLAPKQSLRGMTIKIWRTKGVQGRMYIEQTSWREDKARELPPDEDPQQSLFKFWGVEWTQEIGKRCLGPAVNGHKSNGKALASAI